MVWLEGAHEPRRQQDNPLERQLGLREVLADKTMPGGSRRDLPQLAKIVGPGGNFRQHPMSQPWSRM